MIPNVRFHPYIRDGFVWGVKYMNGGWMILPSFFFPHGNWPIDRFMMIYLIQMVIFHS